jgi:hypothetical protein
MLDCILPTDTSCSLTKLEEQEASGSTSTVQQNELYLVRAM